MAARKRQGRSRAVAESAPASGAYGPRRVLLDTHVWLWWIVSDRRLGKRARGLIQHAGDARLSIASMWEIAIKRQTGKLTLHEDLDLSEGVERDGLVLLPITVAHIEAFRALPRLSRDPFDRMLVAQSQVEGLTIVTADDTIATYDVPAIDARR